MLSSARTSRAAALVNRLELPAAGAVELQQLAQAADVGVEAAADQVGTRAPDRFLHLLPGDDVAAPAEQQHGNLHLARLEPHLPVLEPYRRAFHVDAIRRQLQRARRRVQSRTACESGHAREELEAPHGLGEVIVGATVERGDDIALRVMRRDEHDGRVQSPLADPPQHLEAGRRGDLPIEHGQVEGVTLYPADRGGAVAGAAHAVSRRFHPARREVALECIVLEEENAHARFSRAAPRR